MPVTLIGLDADDTLWHNEPVFRAVQAEFGRLLAPFADEEAIDRTLAAVERRNIGLFGYGAKGFTLSMLEAALELGGDDLPARLTAEILAAGREMLRHPVEALPGVAEALDLLADRADLILVTKGDLFHQEAKLAASGLGDHFAGVEIVSEKDAACYARAFRRHGAGPESGLMAGNSVKSDVLPMLHAGGWAALVPYPLVWALEAADAPTGHGRFRELATLAELPAWIDHINGET